jgi:hypothetical protein
LKGQGQDPFARQEATVTRREQATRSLLAKRHGPRRALILALLRPAQRFAPLREDALADASLGWPLLRRLCLVLGRRLTARQAVDRSDDVFWLTADEIGVAAKALDAGSPWSRTKRQ